MRKFVLTALGATAALTAAALYVYYSVDIDFDYLTEEDWWKGQA